MKDRVLRPDHSEAADRALTCDPASDGSQCSAVVDVGLVCACPAALNPLEVEAIAALQALQVEYAAAGCYEPRDIACDECMEVLASPCGPTGQCTQSRPN